MRGISFVLAVSTITMMTACLPRNETTQVRPLDVCAHDMTINSIPFYSRSKTIASLSTAECLADLGKPLPFSKNGLDEIRQARAQALNASREVDDAKAEQWRCDLGIYDSCLRSAARVLIPALVSPAPLLSSECASAGGCREKYLNAVNRLREAARASNDELGAKVADSMAWDAPRGEKAAKDFYTSLLYPSFNSVAWGAETYCLPIMSDYLDYPGEAEMILQRRNLLSKYSENLVREIYEIEVSKR